MTLITATESTFWPTFTYNKVNFIKYEQDSQTGSFRKDLAIRSSCREVPLSEV